MVRFQHKLLYFYKQKVPFLIVELRNIQVSVLLIYLGTSNYYFKKYIF